MDNFNNGHADLWTHYDPLGGLGFGPMALYSFPGGNTYRISAPARPAALQQAGQARAGSLFEAPEQTDFYIEVDVVNWNNSIDQAVGILARITTPALGMTDGYAFTIQVMDTDISISRLTDEAPTDLADSSKNFVPAEHTSSGESMSCPMWTRRLSQPKATTRATPAVRTGWWSPTSPP